MPPGAGSLVASLGLHTDEFATGWGRAEAIARSGASGIARSVQPAARGTADFESSVRAAGAQINAMAAGLLNELAPGLGATTQVLATATRGVGTFGGAVGYATGGITLAVGGLTLLVNQQTASAKAQAELNAAVQRFDVGALLSRTNEITAFFREIDQQAASGAFGAFVARLRLGFDQLAGIVTGTDNAFQRLVKTEQALEKAYPFEAARKLAAVDVQRLAILQSTEALSRVIADRQGRVGESEAAAQRQINLTQQLGLAKAHTVRLEYDLQRAQLVTAGASEKVLAIFDKVRDAAISTELAQTRLAVATEREATAAAQKARLESRIGPSDVNIFGGQGETSIFGGLRDIRELNRDIGTFSAEIKDLAKAGIPARDLFDEIAKRQAKVDETITSLKQKYADMPAVLERLIVEERKFAAGGLQRTLDAAVRSAQNLKEGFAAVDTGLTEVVNTVDNGFIPAASDTVQATTVMASGFVFLTERAREFAFTLDAVIGRLQVLRGGNIAVPAFGGNPGPGE